MPRGVFCRGDDRHPIKQNIFAEGFSKRKPKKKREQRFPLGKEMAFDIKSSTAVCVTKDFYAAALFPVDTKVYNSWIYLLDLDVSQMFNAQQHQYDYVR